MIKIEKISNGYILEIEEPIAMTMPMEDQMDKATEMMKKIMPQLQEMAESDSVLSRIQNNFEDQENKNLSKPITHSNKVYLPTFKEVMAYLDMLTEKLDEKNILIKPI